MESLKDLLSLVGVFCTTKEIKGWSFDQRAAASKWAARSHLRASDNKVDVPRRPKFLPLPRNLTPMAREFEIPKVVKIKSPRIPNFISVDGQYVSIATLTDGQLKAVGEMWTKELIEVARRKREIQTKAGGG